jgi:uncharacterized glyoxalase superfamily protein PhnB
MIIPLMKCTQMSKAVSFYSNVLDFEVAFSTGINDTPSFSILKRGEDYVHLSSHSGDGVVGSVFSVIVSDIDLLFDRYVKNGLKPIKQNSPVHQGPLDQTWGTREFYVDDPDGNTIRYIQLKT